MSVENTHLGNLHRVSTSQRSDCRRGPDARAWFSEDCMVRQVIGVSDIILGGWFHVAQSQILLHEARIRCLQKGVLLPSSFGSQKPLKSGTSRHSDVFGCSLQKWKPHHVTS
ncbi:uncharacterized protein LOC123988694 [Osmia bicornis bicornis]|uniref:uncharacterized protein LOC123988694 n=1 Tax=Osmia bicornis bicornis TaxID=1437191 RepID=UPI001EAEA231|nr:uncharacterized protein LOC123988694 [Osmia bicornis bicornis]